MGMPSPVPMASPGLQAIVLCGPGSSFPTFTSNPDENPKALLPIANRPMVWYPLDFCYRAGIKDITLICPPTSAKAVRQALETNPFLTGLPQPHPKILAPEGLTHTTGTADILRLSAVREAINSDFLVLPCDLVCGVPGEKFLQTWMTSCSGGSSYTHGSSSTTTGTPSFGGGLGVWYNTETDLAAKGEETDFIAVTPIAASPVAPPKDSLIPELSNLVWSMPTVSLNDLTEKCNGLPIRHGLIRAHPRIRMRTRYRDAHLYVFPRWILDFINQNEKLENISEDVIGWWAKAGWQSGLAEKLGLGEILRPDDGNDGSRSRAESTPSPVGGDAPKGSFTDDVAGGSRGSQRTNGRDKGDNAGSKGVAVPPILAYIHPSESTAIVRRADTAQQLLNVSLRLAKLPSIEEAGSAASPFAHNRKVAYPEGVKFKTTITRQDSLIGDNVTVEEKVAIKESVVGAGCQIGEGSKILSCLLMDGVVVGKNCKLTKCVLGKRSVIGDGSTLISCEVQENLLVEAKTEEKDNKLVSSDGLEATEEEMDEVLQDMDDEVQAFNHGGL